MSHGSKAKLNLMGRRFLFRFCISTFHAIARSHRWRRGDAKKAGTQKREERTGSMWYQKKSGVVCKSGSWPSFGTKVLLGSGGKLGFMSAKAGQSTRAACGSERSGAAETTTGSGSGLEMMPEGREETSETGCCTARMDMEHLRDMIWWFERTFVSDIGFEVCAYFFPKYNDSCNLKVSG